MNVYFLSFIVSFFYIGIKSIQQLNVNNKLYWLIPPFSILMSLLEIYVMSTVTHHDAQDLTQLALALGCGGGFGSVVATYLHDYLLKNKEKIV